MKRTRGLSATLGSAFNDSEVYTGKEVKEILREYLSEE